MDAIRKETLTIRKKWSAPTPKEVQLLWCIACWKFGVPVYKLHEYLGIGERAARRWRSDDNAREDGTSIIKYPNWVLLVALVTEKCILERSQFKPTIAPALIMKPREYVAPPLEDVLNYLGADSASGLTRSQLGFLIGVHPDLLGKSAQKMPFHLWAAILLHLRVPVTDLLESKGDAFEIIGKSELSVETLEDTYRCLLEAVK